MTVDEIQRKLEEISRAATDHDYEHAHSLEDKLYHDVLFDVARGFKDSHKLAREALRSQEIDFVRWCA